MTLKLLLLLVDAHYNGVDSNFQFLQALKRVEQHYRSKGRRYTADCLKTRIDKQIAVYDGKAALEAAERGEG